MKHKIIGSWIAVMLLVLLSPAMASVAHAGEINGAEQKVISAASGAFTYQGKTYVLKSQYIAEGRSKLAEDGIDLSDAEANSYIGQFHNSYAELVESGYCDEIGGESEGQDSGKKDDSDAKDQSDKGKTDKGKNDKGSSDSDDNTGNSKHTKAEKARNELFIKTFLGEPQDDAQENQKSDSETNTKNSSKNEDDTEWLEKEDLGITVDFNEEDITAAKEQNLTISESGNKYQIQAQNSEKKDETKQDDILDGILHLEQWKMLSYIIFGVAFCTVIGISLYIWKVQKRKHKKRKLRLGLAVAAGISVAGCAFLLMFVMSLYFGLYNKEAIHRQLMESDYYSGITQMTKQLAEEKLQQAGCDEEIAADVFNLSHVYIEEKQYIDAILSGKKDSEISTEAIESTLMEQIPAFKGEDKTALIDELTDMYQSTLQFELGKIIRKNQQAFLPWCYVVAGASIVLLLLLFILTYVMYGYLHKSVRVCAAGIFASSLLVTGIPLVMRLQHFAGRFYAEPIYYQQFIQKYISWSVNVMLYIGCIGLLAAVALTVWKRYLHMIYAS